MPAGTVVILTGQSSLIVFEDLIRALMLPTIEAALCFQLPSLTVRHMEDMERLIRLRDAIESTRAVTLSFPVADIDTCVFLFGQDDVDPQFIFTLDRKNLAYIPPWISMKWWGRQPAT